MSFENEGFEMFGYKLGEEALDENGCIVKVLGFGTRNIDSELIIISSNKNYMSVVSDSIYNNYLITNELYKDMNYLWTSSDRLTKLTQ